MHARRTVVAVAAIAMLALLPITRGAASPASHGSRLRATTHTVNVGQGGAQFVDADTGTHTTTVTVGDTVKWHWVGSNHSTTRTIEPETWGSGVKSAPTTDFPRTFNVAGTFLYWCTVHGSSSGGMQGTVVVVDPNTPTVSIGDLSHAEGNTGSTAFDFPLTLSHSAAQDVTVHYSTSNGTAASGSDYTAVSNATATITAGQTTGVATVQVTGDTAAEPNETFAVTLSSPANATIADGSATGTITNDDGPPPLPTLSIGDASITEGNSGTSPMTFPVTLSSASGSNVTAHFQTTDGTATAPADYKTASGTVTITAGMTSAPVTVNIVGDKLKETDETFTVSLSSPSGATIADGDATGTIHDNGDICTIVGTGGNDTLSGTSGADTICGLKGNDTIDGMGGSDVLLGAAGADSITGGGGIDSLKGSAGDDTLHGTDGVSGNDTVNGGKGTDTCDADSGDTLKGCP